MLPPLYPPIQQKALSKSMAEKVAGSGLELYHLTKAFQKGGTEGLRSLLTDKNGDKVRVSSSKNVTEKLLLHVGKMVASK